MSTEMIDKRLEEILGPSHYQTFDFMGQTDRDSASGKKWLLSYLDAYDLKDKTVLDIGCNAGYFLFRMLQKEPKKLVGIDMGEKFINVANSLNNEYFKSDKVQFIWADFFVTRFWSVFDFVICFSTFHYFGDDQVVFFDKCYALMKDTGILLLEVEEYPINDFAIINSNPRPADNKSYYYPNEKKMEEYVFGKFRILNKYKSVKQGGSLYDRWFYELYKI
jgi:cyclopropane fatty-acyl-phospholipid synthase-like methyltransferase